MTTYATQELLHAHEGTFGQYGATPNSATWDRKLPVLEARLTPDQMRGPDGSIQGRQNERRPGYLMMRSATLELDMDFAGHFSAATGALTETWQQKLLTKGLGGGDVTSVGGTVSGGATTTSIPFASATLVRGGVCRIGAAGDSQGEGRAYMIGSQATTPAALLNATAGAPDAADIIYACQMAYPTETGHGSERFLLGFPGTNEVIAVFGCFLSGLRLSSPMGDLPRLTLTYRCAYFADVTAITIPHTSLTLESCEAAITAGGEVAFQTVATTTRATLSPSEFDLSIELGTAERRSQGGVGQFQSITGFDRTFTRASITLLLPRDDVHRTLFDTDGPDTTHKYLVHTFNVANGRSVGVAAKKMFPSGNRPHFEDYNGLTYQRVTYDLREGDDTTTNLSRAPFILFSS